MPRKEEQEKAKQFIEKNSIPKKKIKDKINDKINELKNKKPEPVGSGFGSSDNYFKWKYQVIDENKLLKKEIKDIQELLKDK